MIEAMLTKLIIATRLAASKAFSGPISYLLRAARFSFHSAFYPRAARRISLQRYCADQLAHQLPKYVQIPGRSHRTIETDQIYVPTQLGGRTTRTVAGYRESADVVFYHRDDPFAPSRLIVTGDPGSGKTTLTKHIFRLICQAAATTSARRRLRLTYGRSTFLSELGRGQHTYLPILIELKSLAPPDDLKSDRDYGDWALTLLKEKVTSARGYDLDRLFDSYLTGPGLFVLLDGLDEVSATTYPLVRRAINGLAQQLEEKSPENRIVLTMRSQFHQQVADHFRTNFPTNRAVLPFTNSAIYAFLLRWPFPPDDRAAHIHRIFGDLADRPNLREMCRNPLVLSMYVSVDQDNPESPAPDTRTAFYSQVVEELLVARRSRQVGMAARSVIHERRERVLGRLAWENLSDETTPLNLAPWPRAIELICEVYLCDTGKVDALLREMVVDTGVVEVERELESLRFIHLTFCEFLAARAVVTSPDLGWDVTFEIFQKLRNSKQKQVRTRLNEVIPFTTGLANRSSRVEMLERLDTAADDDELLGRCILETQSYDTEVWDHYVERESAYLARTTALDSEWLRRLHLLSVALRDAEAWGHIFQTPSQHSVADVLTDIASGSKRQEIAVLKGFAEQDAPAAYRLGRDLGIDFADLPSQTAAMCLGNRPFVDLIAHEATNAPASDLRWPRLITEAGLSGYGIAREFSTHRAPRSWLTTAESVPRKMQWKGLYPRRLGYRYRRLASDTPTSPKPGEYSLYTAALTRALSSDETPVKYRESAQLVGMRGPGPTRIGGLSRILGITIFTIGTLLALLKLNGDRIVFGGATLVAVSLIGFWCLSYGDEKLEIFTALAYHELYYAPGLLSTGRWFASQRHKDGVRILQARAREAERREIEAERREKEARQDGDQDDAVKVRADGGSDPRGSASF